MCACEHRETIDRQSPCYISIDLPSTSPSPPPTRHQYILYYSSTTNYHPDILPLVPLCSWSLDRSLHVSRITARRIHHARLSASLVARPAPSLVPAEPHAAVVNGKARFTGRMGHADCCCFIAKWVLVQSFVSVFLECTLDQGKRDAKGRKLTAGESGSWKGLEVLDFCRISSFRIYYFVGG